MWWSREVPLEGRVLGLMEPTWKQVRALSGAASAIAERSPAHDLKGKRTWYAAFAIASK